MRNIFDQYSQPENRLTHALLASLAEDRWLLNSFVLWVSGRDVKREKLRVQEQSMPGELHDCSEEEAQRRGLPDGCITNGDNWGLLIESKFAARPTTDQLHRHLRTARRQGLDDASLLLLTIHAAPGRLPANVVSRQWYEVYAWLQKCTKRSFWARRCLEYIQVAETKEAAEDYLREGKLTVFTGIPFGRDEPYSYGQAKRILKLLREELCKDKRLATRLSADLVAPGRPGITGREGTGVWDYIPLTHARGAMVFTEFPHLTLDILNTHVGAYVTFPNGIKSKLRLKLLGPDPADFEVLVRSVTINILQALKGLNGFVPEIVFLQRHYKSQRSLGIVDCRLRFDARTVLPRKSRHSGGVKHQPQWLRAAHDALAHSRSNLQLQIGGTFPYDTCPATHNVEIVRAISNVWLACSPIVKRTMG